MHRTTLHRARGAALLLAGALLLSACGGGSGNDAAAPRASTSTSASPTDAAPAEAPAVEHATVEPAEFSGPAVDAFGAPKVQVAYAQMAQFAERNSYDIEHMDYGVSETPADYEVGIVEHMTPTMVEAYRTIVADAFAGDQDALNNLHAFTRSSLIGGRFAYRDSGPVVVDHVIRDPRVEYDGTNGGRLALTFTQSVNLRLLEEGQPILLGLEKIMTFYLVKTPPVAPHAWLLDGLSTEWAGGAEVPDTSRN